MNRALCITESCKQAVDERRNYSMNTASLRFDVDNLGSFADHMIGIYEQSVNCWQCPLVNTANTTSNSSLTTFVDTDFPVRLLLCLFLPNNSCAALTNCRSEYSFSEGGIYSIKVSTHTSFGLPACGNLNLENSPSNAYFPIMYATFFYIALAALWIIGLHFYRANFCNRFLICLHTEQLINSDLGAPANSSPDVHSSEHTGNINSVSTSTRRRLQSLDTFRGFSLVIMIFVNYGGGGYWFFRHSAWNGLTVADLVFPWFVFIMGTAIHLSFNGLLRRGHSRWRIIKKVLWRCVVLFFLGLIINTKSQNSVPLSDIRIPGVLQRLALTYLVVGFLHALFARVDDPLQFSKLSSVRDLIYYWCESVIHLLLLAVYCVVMYFIPAPGCPGGYLGPGGLHDHGQHQNCTGGIAGYIDRWLLGSSHIYATGTSRTLYKTVVRYDPEGILGTLTSVFLCYLGLQAGKIIQHHRHWKERIIRWLIWALFLGVLAIGLTEGSQNDGVIPINKNLWSVTFMLSLASLAFVALTIFYLAIDVFDVWTGAPFIFPGMNSIVVYCCHEIFAGCFPVSWKVANTHFAQLNIDLWGTTLWVVVAAIMYYKQIFISI